MRMAKTAEEIALAPTLQAYEDGDYSTALREFRVFAERGYVEAQTSLGFMYVNGVGVPKNDAEAVKWWRLAAERGNARAQHNLGWMLQHGKGVPENKAEAVEWWRLAAEQGHTHAQHCLDARCVKD